MTTYIPTLVAIIAKVLNIVERLLDEWVDLTVNSWTLNASVGYVNNCAPSANITCSMTTCGNDFVEKLEDMIHLMVGLGNQILLGLSGTYENVS